MLSDQNQAMGYNVFFLQWSASTAMAVLSTLPTFTRLFTKVGCWIILSLSFN